LKIPDLSARNDAITEHLAGPERQDPPWCDRNLDARLRITPDAFALFAQNEASKARYLHILAGRKRCAEMLQYLLDNGCGIRAGKAYFMMDLFG